MKVDVFNAFVEEMEHACSAIMERYGFDEEIMGAYQVGKIFEFKRKVYKE